MLIYLGTTKVRYYVQILKKEQKCFVSNTIVLGKVGDLEFKAAGKQLLKLGWREIYVTNKSPDKSSEEESIIPHFEKGKRRSSTQVKIEGKFLLDDSLNVQFEKK